MIIGVDFDNTIVRYDDLFLKLAREESLIPDSVPATKTAIRNYLRQAGNEDAWTELQGRAYGSEILRALPMPGVLDFFKKGRDLGHIFYIISHKTLFPFKGPQLNLHEAARQWLQTNGFLSTPLSLREENAYFELTKQEKLKRIDLCRCDIFIDDLPEFLLEHAFPRNVTRYLFDPQDEYDGSEMSSLLIRFQSWQAFAEDLFL